MKMSDLRIELSAAEYYSLLDFQRSTPEEVEFNLRTLAIPKGYEVFGFLDGNTVTQKDWKYVPNGCGWFFSRSDGDFKGLSFPYRIFLKPKEPKYRYVTDGKMSIGKPGQFYVGVNGGFFEYHLMPFSEQLKLHNWFDREEVTE